MDAFLVDHDAADESAAVFGKAVTRMGDLLGHLNKVLSDMDTAVQGQAGPLWADQQTAWNRDYGTMQSRLSAGVQIMTNIHSTFREGDLNGARLFT